MNRWVITAENCLTGAREVVSLPMERHEAIARIKELNRTSADEFRAYTIFRIREFDGKQLTLFYNE